MRLSRNLRFVFAAVFIWVLLWNGSAFAQADPPQGKEIRVLEIQGTVEVSPKGATTWLVIQTNQVLHPFDRLRTSTNSRVTIRLSDQSVVPFGAVTEVEILPPHGPEAESGLHILRGILSFFHRGRPGSIRIITPGAVAGMEGTEFVISVDETNNAERTTLSVVDGRVRFSNDQASLTLTNGQQAIADPDKAPVLTASFTANNVLQWCFYYPAVLDLRDLPLSAEEEQALALSLDAYRAGDLLQALAKYPEGRQPESDAEKIYYGALLLSVGQVVQTETVLAKLSRTNSLERLPRLAAALRPDYRLAM